MLSTRELQALERDFVLFLASQGISADLWQQYTGSESHLVNEAITTFSDHVLELVYNQCQLIEFLTANGWLFYRFNDELKIIELRGITIAEGSDLDFRQLDPSTAFKLIQTAPEGTFLLIRADKEIVSSKAIEVHGLLTRGGFISENLNMYHLLSTFL